MFLYVYICIHTDFKVIYVDGIVWVGLDLILFYEHRSAVFINLPGLVNEEKEPLEIAYRGIAEIIFIYNIILYHYIEWEGVNQVLSKSCHCRNFFVIPSSANSRKSILLE